MNLFLRVIVKLGRFVKLKKNLGGNNLGINCKKFKGELEFA